MKYVLLLLFLFQAEDGIRVGHVTGVQTCALPILKAQSVDGLSISSPGASCTATPGSKHATFRGMASVIRSTGTTTERSEERRVGKECRGRWSTYDVDKTT